MNAKAWLAVMFGGMVGAAIAHTFGQTLAVGLCSVIVLIGAIGAMNAPWGGGR